MGGGYNGIREEKMETTIVYRDDGKENGDYSLGFRV